MNKKRYAGLLWTKAEKYDKMDTKGLETVRRDNCLLVRKVFQTGEGNLTDFAPPYAALAQVATKLALIHAQVYLHSTSKTPFLDFVWFRSWTHA